MEFHRSNHFVPQTYLKRWSPDGKKIWGYRLLVSHQNVPLWNLYSIRGIAYQPHLYTKLSPNGEETDEFERWLDREYEKPAEEAIFKATTNRKLKSEDWEKLILFTAAQCVRTPAQLVQNMERWHTEIPELVKTTLQNTTQELEKAVQTGKPLSSTNTNEDAILPIRVSREPSLEPDKILLKVETIIGRGMWLFGIKHLLTNTAKILLKHKWSIMHSNDVEWITSDDPVIRLNYYRKGSYDFGGGWGYRGSEILLPISPNHILYTQVGEKNSPCFKLSAEMSAELQQIIAAHSHRWIFSKEPIKSIESLRTRCIDPIAFSNEMEAWKKWNHEQSDAEKNLRGIHDGH